MKRALHELSTKGENLDFRPILGKLLYFTLGGVWRTRWNGRHVLVPCMYENAQMIKVDEGSFS